MTIEVVIPVTARPTERSLNALAPPPVLGPHVTVGLIDNGKLNAATILVRVAERLVDRGLAGEYRLLRKSTAVEGVSDDELAALRADAHLVLTGVGDCGACSSWTVLDAIACDRAGIVAFPLITKPFATLVTQTVANQGHACYPALVVEHPIYGRCESWLDDVATALSEQIVEHLAAATAVGPRG